jgi:hypothetical protein
MVTLSQLFLGFGMNFQVVAHDKVEACFYLCFMRLASRILLMEAEQMF